MLSPMVQLNVRIFQSVFFGGGIEALEGYGGALYVGCSFLTPCGFSGVVNLLSSVFDSHLVTQSITAQDADDAASMGGAVFVGAYITPYKQCGPEQVVSIENFTLLVENCTFTNNTAASKSTALTGRTHGSLWLIRCSKRTAETPVFSAGGGALYVGLTMPPSSMCCTVSNFTAAIQGTKIIGNQAGLGPDKSLGLQGGAGIYVLFGQALEMVSSSSPIVQFAFLKLIDCEVLDNVATADVCAYCNGGGIFVQNAAVSLTKTLLLRNMVSSAGGGVFSSTGTSQLEMVSSEVSMNSATEGAQLYWGSFGTVLLFQSMVNATSTNSEFVIVSSLNVAFNGSRVNCATLGTVLIAAPVLSSFREFTSLFPLSALQLSTISIGCAPCSDFTYTQTPSWTSNGSLPSSVIPSCLQCPTGGRCQNGSITALPGYWGATDEKGHVSFTVCPGGYCCDGTPASPCNSTSSCTGHRSGVLCGECLAGYVESLGSPACTMSLACDRHHLLLVWTGIVIALLASGLSVFCALPVPAPHCCTV